MPLDSLPRTPSPVTLNASIDTPVGETLTNAGAGVLLGQALRDLIAERIAQVDEHGHTIESDQAYHPDELPRAAHAYLRCAISQIVTGDSPDPRAIYWPWSNEWNPRDHRTNLVKAGALIWAALDYIDHLPRGANDDRIAA